MQLIKWCSVAKFDLLFLLLLTLNFLFTVVKMLFNYAFIIVLEKVLYKGSFKCIPVGVIVRCFLLSFRDLYVAIYKFFVFYFAQLKVNTRSLIGIVDKSPFFSSKIWNRNFPVWIYFTQFLRDEQQFQILGGLFLQRSMF